MKTTIQQLKACPIISKDLQWNAMVQTRKDMGMPKLEIKTLNALMQLPNYGELSDTYMAHLNKGYDDLLAFQDTNI